MPIALLLAAGLAVSGCEASDRSTGAEALTEGRLGGAEQAQSQLDIATRPTDRSSSNSRLASSGQPATLDLRDQYPETSFPEDVEAKTRELVSQQEDSQDLSANWEQLWRLLEDGGVSEEAIPLELAPHWILAATNTNRLGGCPEVWLSFGDEVQIGLEQEYPNGYRFEETWFDARVALVQWALDYSNHEATEQLAAEACASSASDAPEG
jgi:hypothetical protein